MLSPFLELAEDVVVDKSRSFAQRRSNLAVCSARFFILLSNSVRCCAFLHRHHCENPWMFRATPAMMQCSGQYNGFRIRGAFLSKSIGRHQMRAQVRVTVLYFRL